MIKRVVIINKGYLNGGWQLIQIESSGIELHQMVFDGVSWRPVDPEAWDRSEKAARILSKLMNNYL